MSYKYFVGSGCSFSDGGDSWIHKLPSRIGIEKIHNIARGSCGNQFIRTNLIYKVSELLREGVNPHDILVCVQWTGTSRVDMMVDSEHVMTPNKFNKDFEVTNLGYYQVNGNHPLHEKLCEEYNTHAKGYIHSGGANNWTSDQILMNERWGFVLDYRTNDFQEKYLSNYFKYYFTEELGFLTFLNEVLMVQNFLKVKEIPYLMFCGWDNINSYADEDSISLLEKFSDQRYLFDNIDLDNFVFVESDLPNWVMRYNQTIEIQTEYGGMWQYLCDEGIDNPENRHPSSKGNLMWTEYLQNELEKRNYV